MSDPLLDLENKYTQQGLSPRSLDEIETEYTRDTPPLQDFDSSRGAGFWPRLRASMPRTFEGTYRSFEESFGPENVRIHQATGQIQFRTEDDDGREKWFNATASDNWARNLQDYTGDAVELIPTIIAGIISSFAWPVRAAKTLQAAYQVGRALVRQAATVGATAGGMAVSRTAMDDVMNDVFTQNRTTVPDEELPSGYERYVFDPARIAATTGATDLAFGGALSSIPAVSRIIANSRAGQAVGRKVNPPMRTELREIDEMRQLSQQHDMPLTPAQQGNQTAMDKEVFWLSQGTKEAGPLRRLYGLQEDLAETQLNRNLNTKGTARSRAQIADEIDNVPDAARETVGRQFADIDSQLPAHRRPSVLRDSGQEQRALDNAYSQFRGRLGKLLHDKKWIALDEANPKVRTAVEQEVRDLMESGLSARQIDDVLLSTRPDLFRILPQQGSDPIPGYVVRDLRNLFKDVDRVQSLGWERYSDVQTKLFNIMETVKNDTNISSRAKRELEGELNRLYGHLKDSKRAILTPEGADMSRLADNIYSSGMDDINLVNKVIKASQRGRADYSQIEKIFQQGPETVEAFRRASANAGDPDLFNEARARILMDAFRDETTENFRTLDQFRRKLRAATGEQSYGRYFKPDDELVKNFYELARLRSAIKTPTGKAASPGGGVSRATRPFDQLPVVKQALSMLNGLINKRGINEHYLEFAEDLGRTVNRLADSGSLERTLADDILVDVNNIVNQTSTRVSQAAGHGTRHGLAVDAARGDVERDRIDVDAPIRLDLPMYGEYEETEDFPGGVTTEIRRPQPTEVERIRERQVDESIHGDGSVVPFTDDASSFVTDPDRNLERLNWGMGVFADVAYPDEHLSEVTPLPEIEEEEQYPIGLEDSVEFSPLPELDDEIDHEEEAQRDIEAEMAREREMEVLDHGRRGGLNLSPITTTATPEEVKRRKETIERRKKDEEQNREYERIMSQVRGF